MINLRCLDVRYSAESTTLWIPLPMEAWEVCGICQCANCKGRIGFWDTMAVATKPQRVNKIHNNPVLGGTGHTFLVHMPERHPFHVIEKIEYNDAWSTGVGFYTDPLSRPNLKAKLDAYVEDSKVRGLSWEVENVERLVRNGVAEMPHNEGSVPR